MPESAWKLLPQRTNGAVVSPSENRMDTERGLHERIAGPAGYRSVLDAEVQLATATSIQQWAGARSVRD